MRQFNRKESFISVFLSTGRDFAADGVIKTFTVNVSQGGVFVHTTQPFTKGERVWLRFSEMLAADPVQAVVCWQIEWGTCRSIPGIGVMFDFQSEEQADAVRRTLRV